MVMVMSMFGHVMLEVELTGILHKRNVIITVVWIVFIMVMTVEMNAVIAMMIVMKIMILGNAMISVSMNIVKVAPLAV
jgi:hypothetical protein